MKKIGRNEPCHCGSGKKYKNCHLNADDQKESRSRGYMLIAVIVLLVVISAFGIYMKTQSDSGPNGPAPEGKVWSEEHGHWH